MVTELTVNLTKIDLVEGDITQQTTDAIVNAANSGLAGGGGVDGAIHRAAGWDELQAALRKFPGCATGDAVITEGFKLDVEHIIHAVGPVYSNPSESEKLLRSAYKRSLELAVQNEVKTIAFPALSTGAFRFPMIEAADVALQSVIDFAKIHTSIELIRFVLFGQEAFDTFKEILNEKAEIEGKF